MSYAPGHQAHWIQAKKAGRTPWGWRRGRVRTVRGLEVVIRYRWLPASITVWHHQRLGLRRGDRVRVHEQYHLLEVGTRWVSYRLVAGGLGAVNAPRIRRPWRTQGVVPATDLATGIAYPDLSQPDTDHSG